MRSLWSSSLVLGASLIAPSLLAAGAGIPYAAVSSPADDAALPAAVVPRAAASAAGPAARLVATEAGRTRVSFAREDGTLGRYVLLGFSYRGGSAAVTVSTDRPVAAVRVAVDGEELLPLGGGAFATMVALPEDRAVDAVVKLERLDASPVGVTVGLKRFQTCTSWIHSPCGAALDESPEGLVFPLSPARAADAGDPADLIVPAIVRTPGGHGPVRSDLTMVNRAGAPLRVSLRLRTKAGVSSESFEVELPAGSPTTLADVAGLLLGPGADAEGVLEVRGFAPVSPSDLLVETYYDDGTEGRIGTTVPWFSGEAAAGRSARILTAPGSANPRLNVFSAPAASPEFDVVATLSGPAGTFTVPMRLPRESYTSVRLSELFPGAALSDTLLTVETSDAAVHAIATRNSALSGTPTVFASN